MQGLTISMVVAYYSSHVALIVMELRSSNDLIYDCDTNIETTFVPPYFNAWSKK